jgi:hypothetical protein
MKVGNFYCNQELMAMATNLYYHCWFARVYLQETHPFQLLLMLLFLFISLILFCCSYPPLSQLHTYNLKHTRKDIRKKGKKKQRDHKNFK